LREGYARGEAEGNSRRNYEGRGFHCFLLCLGNFLVPFDHYPATLRRLALFQVLNRLVLILRYSEQTHLIAGLSYAKNSLDKNPFLPLRYSAEA
jgi:hypothetical protein